MISYTEEKISRLVIAFAFHPIIFVELLSLMKLKFKLLILFLFSTLLLKAQDSLMIRKVYDEALVNGKCYSNLHDLCKNIGPRLSGSPNAQKAVEWGEKLMESYGFDNVYLQPVMVPQWVRGQKEQA